MKLLRIPALALAPVLALPAFAQTTPAAPPAGPAPQTAAPAPAAAAAPNPSVGGVAMDAGKTIVANASAAPNLSTLVKAITAADLTATLSGPRPYTVFAPTNDAFTRLPPDTLAQLMKPENKALLAKVLTYHVVPGTIDFAQLKAQIAAGNGTATLTTVAGQPLKVTITGNNVVTLTSVNGNVSYLETPDVHQSNGIVHVVNGVLLPKLN
ncbi:fasciclin domain-containing protein [Sphingomonas pruni]|uniref:fasciclin domain-containing protein n=1 Tax=Sphingomonas pruni TaxID=40683 RepID=UPI00082B58E5|nr:fasciclin domain-containing protein [Sphingomonas pruni]